MYQQSKGSAEKPRAVSYFNQFPANFLKPYGKADSPPDEDTISKRTRPISCEWFLRPKVAMSEFTETITQNIEILKDEHIKYIDASKFEEMSEEIQPFLIALNRLNNNKNSKEKNNTTAPTKDDIKTVMSFLYDCNHPLDKAVEDMVILGAAMFTTAIQYIVARSIMTEPAKFAEKLVLENEGSKEFKKGRDVKALRRFLESECLGASSSCSASTTSNAPRALFHQLQDSDDDERE